MPSDPPTLPPTGPRTQPGLLAGLLTGLITAAVALGVGQLVAGLTGPQGSPVVAVGGSAIDLTPPFLKNFAISEFGGHDKTVLVAGILVLLTVFAAVIGAVAVRRFAYGVAGLAVFTAIGLIAVLSRPTTGPGDILPSLAGAAAGLFAMTRLVQAAHASAGASPAGTRGPGEPPGTPPPGPGAQPGREPAPGASW